MVRPQERRILRQLEPRTQHHEVRLALYMAALSAARCNPVLRTLYKRLRAKGKLSKVALTAVMRGLLTYMNHRIKALPSETATAKAQESKQA